MQQWANDLQTALQADKHDKTNQYQVSIIQNEAIFLPKIIVTTHGIEHEYALTQEFFISPEYLQAVELKRQSTDSVQAGAYIARGDKQRPVNHFHEAVEWLMAEAKKGLTIQRYKGLGEMNADQLWDTTMNPETRCLLQVKVEDAIKADEMFTTLMGDQVEPRREFIENNALAVENIDI